MPGAFPFIPGRNQEKSSPLARYLPPVPENVAPAWLARTLPAGSLILDPFGASPRLAVEMAQAGYRVLVAANNPVARFLLEMAANPPAKAELKAALADLAATYKGEERLEPHIRSLYRSACEQCGREVMAEAFLWDRGAPGPFGKIYHCPHCGAGGEHPANQTDIARAAHFAGGGLHRARALERVAPRDDPDRSHAEEALEAYLPRAVYVLFTLINKLDSLPESRRRLLAALLLAACDQANTLWPYPMARSRPRQLTVPPRFRENNIWLALEEAVEQWAAPGKAAPPGPDGSGQENQVVSKGIPVLFWPDLPPQEGGISIFEGRLKDLAHSLPQIQIGAVLAALPRPNQAYWTLSALWTGWLWGREAASPFKSVLRRRRYDWSWHSTALHAALSSLASSLPPETPFLGLIGEVEPGFLSAGLIAAHLAGFELSGLAIREETGQAQVLWRRGETVGRGAPAAGLEDSSTGSASSSLTPGSIQNLSQAAGQAYLRSRGEPAAYIYLHAAALADLLESGELKREDSPAPADVLSAIQTSFQGAFSYRGGFIRFGGSEHSLEVGQWWLREGGAGSAVDGEAAGKIDLPLADRVEMSLVRSLQKQGGSTLERLDEALCAEFPGLLTPDPGLVQVCLESYGEQESPGGDSWRLREQDSPKLRRADLKAMNNLLAEIGGRLGFKVNAAGPLLWLEPDGEVKYAFYVIASALLGKVLFGRGGPGGKGVLVYPGGRAGLVSYKLKNDERLRHAANQGWYFVKFRLLRRMAEDEHLSRENLEAQFALDPMTNRDPQMQLF